MNITELTAKLRHWASMASVTSERVSCLSVEQLTEVAEALEAAQSRIAELEARTLTVNMPEYRNSPDMHTKQFYEAIGFNQGLDACIEAILDAGIKLQIEGE